MTIAANLLLLLSLVSYGQSQSWCGFNEEANKRGYKYLNESYMEWDNATVKCQSLGARLPVLDTKETIDIVKKYLGEADPESLEQWDQSSRRVWLGLNYNSGSGLTWADGQVDRRVT